jgi:hypothetical protein
LVEERDGLFIARLFRTYRNVPFAEQEAELRELLDTLPMAWLSIDKNGIGMVRTVRSPVCWTEYQ